MQPTTPAPHSPTVHPVALSLLAIETYAAVVAGTSPALRAARTPSKRATLTTCWERFERRDGTAATEKLWLLLPSCGDGERRMLGLASEMTEQQAIESSARCGFEAQVSL